MCEREPYGPRTARLTPSARHPINHTPGLLHTASWQALLRLASVVRWRRQLPPILLRVVECGVDARAASGHLEACGRRETRTRSSGEVEGFGLRAGCALAHRMCRAWAPAPLTRPRASTCTAKVYMLAGKGGGGEYDGRVGEQANLITPSSPTVTGQRLLWAHHVGPCA